MERDAFRRSDRTPITAVTASEMREVDRVAVETFGIDLLQLMENAGRTLARVVQARSPSSVTVVAGNGGNGGGGLCCARHLRNHGVTVSVVLDREPAALDGAAAHQYAILDAMDVPVEFGGDALVARTPRLVVDALVGYGLDGPIRGEAATLVAAMDDGDAPIVSLDVPSGIDATTGTDHGAVDPVQVVTLALPKTGLVPHSWPVVLADISVPAGVYDALDIPYDDPFGPDYWIDLARA